MRPCCKLSGVFQFQEVILRNLNRKHARFLSTSQKDGTSREEDQSPFHPTKQQLLKAEHFFNLHGQNAELEESGFKIKKFTKLKPLPEIAMLGRTSVGKSTLINSLLRQKKLAKTSKRPGHTRLINYFNVGSKFYLVDLPGYGYIERIGSGGQHFVDVVENYLKHRAGKELKSICLLIDSKVGIKKTDLIAIEMLEEMDAPFHVALTKIDKVKAGHQELQFRKISRELMALSSVLCYPHVFPVSSKEQTGLSELRYFMGLCTGLFE